MWHVYATDHATAPQDNGPLVLIDTHSDINDALASIAKLVNDSAEYVRYVVIYREGN